MDKITTVGLDIVKRFFQVHAINEEGKVLVRKKLRRNEILDWFAKLEPCLVGLEACGSSTYWAREISKTGHTVKLIPPAYAKPYASRRQKNDRNDAEAICEAVTRPSMRFVAIKTEEQQAIQVLHRARELLVAQQTQTINALRAHLAEFGYAFPQGNAGASAAILAVKEQAESRDLPTVARQALMALVNQLAAQDTELLALEKQMRQWHRGNADSRRIASIPGIGVVTATAIVAAIGDGKQFANAREFAAWVGLVPRQNSSGGKEKLGKISKRGNRQLRTLLVLGATSMLKGRLREKVPAAAWFQELLMRKTPRVASVALANKMARVAWAVLTKGEAYRPAANNNSAINEKAAA